MSQIYPGAISNYYIFIPGVLLPRVDTKFKSPVRMVFFWAERGGGTGFAAGLKSCHSEEEQDL